MKKALEYAKQYDNISEEEIHIITHAKKSLLYNSNTPWCKKGNSNFDVTMGSFDGAESCELIGLYILSQLQNLGINVGLYRDDGLAICDKTPRQIESIKKEICNIFASNDLKITIEANKKTVDFLDITMNLTESTYKPYMKPNNVPLYVNKNSNHPPSILKNIPESINKRLSTISSNEDAFKDAVPPYQEALNTSGYKYKLKFTPTQAPTNNTTGNKRCRKRHISWFNPPYSEHVKTNVGKEFLKLIDKCFPPGHKLHNLLNRNTVKVSYSCMPNMKNVISNQNKSIIKKSEPEPSAESTCNCRNTTCPLEGKCLTPGVIYQATVTRADNHKSETYIGLTENTFKTRYRGHKNSFKHKRKRNATTLSQYIWSLKDRKVKYSLKWKIVGRGSPYSTSTKKCNLCLKEKYFIICRPQMATLNTRNELTTECRHRKKHLLSNFSSKPRVRIVRDPP